MHRPVRIPLVATLALLAVPASAQDVRDVGHLDDLPPLIDREVFFGNPEIAGGKISPDARHVSFLQELDGVLNVWVKGMDEAFEAAKPLTADTTRPVRAYFWSADGSLVVYAQDKGGDENWRVYAVDPTAPRADGSPVPPARDLTPYEEIQARIYAVPDSTPDWIVVGINERDPAAHDVYRLNVRTGERTLVRENTEDVAGWQTDLEGNLRLAIRIDEEGATEILRVEPDSLVPVYRCSSEETCTTLRFHPDEERVYMRTNKDVDLIRLVLLDPETGETELVESDPEGEVDFGGAVFSEETEELLGTYYRGDRIRWYPRDEAFERDLERTREALPGGDLSFRSMTSDGRYWLVAVSSDVDPSTTYLYDRELGDFGLLYRTRPEVPKDHMATMRPVRYAARDEVRIPGYLTIPRNVEPVGLPVVALVHGGPWSRDTWGFNGIVQFLANRGYAVLQPNFRGSSGFGKEFLNLGNEEWGTGAMQHDVTDGVEWLIEQGIADPDRIGIMGGSYGGYATLAGLAFTPELYAAGVDIVGPSNILTLLASIPPYWKPIQAIFHVRVGDPDDPEDLARMRAQSPLFSADRITAPLLVIQGANDPRMKKRESDQIVATLTRLGREVEYLVAPDEGHGFANEDNALAMFAAIEEFLAEHLGGRYQEEMSEAAAERYEVMSVDEDTLAMPDTTTSAPADATIEGFPDASVEPGTAATYERTIEAQGRVIEMELTRRIVETTHEGEAAWIVIDESTGAMGGAVDSTVVRRGTLVPEYRSIHQGQATITMTFEDDSVSGEIRAGPQRMPLAGAADATLFVSGGALELGLGSLDLAPGETRTIHLFSPLEGVAKEYRIEPAGTESLETPAGTFPARELVVSDLEGADDQAYWIVPDTGRVVKSTGSIPAAMGGGTVTTVFAGVE